MNSAADQLLKDCERAIQSGNYDDGRLMARGLSILTGQPAWEKSYNFLLDKKPVETEITRTFINIPKDLSKRLHKLHDTEGQEYPSQSVRNGTQVNVTRTDLKQWIEDLTHETVIGLWTTRLGKGGYHIPHLHPRGENSHVLYIDVPHQSSGQLYFGKPRYADIPPQIFIKPIEGMMIDFPCWLWHGVSTYLHDKPRLALAFDTVKHG